MIKAVLKACAIAFISLLPSLVLGLELAAGGKTDYVIVQGNQGAHWEVQLIKEAVEDLAALLKQSTAADFKIQRTEPHIR